MNINIQVKGVKEALEKINPKTVRNATIRALDRAAASGKTEASKQIRQEYEIKKVDLDKHLKVERVYRNTSAAWLFASISAVSSFFKSRIPLIQFKVKQSGTKIVRTKGHSTSLTKGTRSRIAPVQVQIRKGVGWKIIKGAFVTQMKSGHIGVFQRKGGKRLPIKELTSIGVPLMFGNKRVLDKTKNRVIEQFDKNFTHELDREMKQ